MDISKYLTIKSLLGRVEPYCYGERDEAYMLLLQPFRKVRSLQTGEIFLGSKHPVAPARAVEYSLYIRGAIVMVVRESEELRIGVLRAHMVKEVLRLRNAA